MNNFVAGFGWLIYVLQRVLFVLAVAFAIISLVDWLVRTRRINPFNPLARALQRAAAPVIVPVERRVIRAGGVPTSAPWWALVAVVVGGILLIEVLKFLGGQIVAVSFASTAGPRGIAFLLISWTFGILQVALLIRVLSSWFRISEWNRWIRWTVRLTEPLLRPLRAIIPPMGMLDLTPLILWFALGLLKGWILGGVQ